LNENLMNAGLAFAGKSGNLANANRNYAMLQQQYNDQNRQNQTGMWMDVFSKMFPNFNLGSVGSYVTGAIPGLGG
jgi:hypothetical protein